MNDSLENTLGEATEWLIELPDTWYSRESADEALAGALQWVAAVNAEWAAEPEALSAGAIEKLRKWIERLLEKMRQLAKDAGAESCAITVGTKQVAVTVTFPAQ